MRCRLVQKVFWKVSQATPPSVLLPGHRRVPSVHHASLGILQNQPMERSHSPPEMHAMDHLARRHTKAFVCLA